MSGNIYVRQRVIYNSLTCNMKTMPIIPLMRQLNTVGSQTPVQLAEAVRLPVATVTEGLQQLHDVFGAVESDGDCWSLIFSPQWLNEKFLRASLPGATVIEETPSTNELAKAASRGSVFFTEHQTCGRGRRGRPWVAMPGGSLMLSVRVAAPTVLSGVSLAVGVALWRVLGSNLRLKWPNDLLDAEGKKIGGILIETAGDDIVVGVGINLFMTSQLQKQFSRPAAALSIAHSRNAGAVLVGGEIRRACAQFAQSGLTNFLDDALTAHYFRPNDELSFMTNSGAARGRFVGFSAAGALCLGGASGVREYFSGEINHVVGS